MRTEKVDWGEEKIKETLTKYISIERELSILIQEFEENSGREKQMVKETIKEKYKGIKDEVGRYYKYFSRRDIEPVGYTESIFVPAVSDIHVKISGIGTNRISSNSISEFRSAVYDISSYASYWLHQMK